MYYVMYSYEYEFFTPVDNSEYLGLHSIFTSTSTAYIDHRHLTMRKLYGDWTWWFGMHLLLQFLCSVRIFTWTTRQKLKITA
jgi:hypothetical protein